MRGFNQTMEVRRLAALLFGKIDYMISPTAPIPAFPAERCSPGDDPEKPFEHIAFTVPWNFSEQPAVSINCAFTTVRPADRRADRRPAPRRPWRAQARQGLRDRARADHELAEAAAIALILAFRISAATACRSSATAMHFARTASVAASRSGTMIAIVPAACAAVMP